MDTDTGARTAERLSEATTVVGLNAGQVARVIGECVLFPTPGRTQVPRTTYTRLPTERLDGYDPRSRRTRRGSWAHSPETARTVYGSDGERMSGDAVNRESLAHPVVVGTAAGRPSNPYEALMECPPGVEPELDSVTAQEGMERVDALLALLPPRERQVLVLCVLEGLSVREAAEAVGLSKSQVQRFVQRAKDSLAELLGGDVPTGATVDALASLAPAQPPELGEYRQPAEKDEELPQVGDDEWRRYEAAEARMRRGEASKAELAFVVRFEKRNGLPSSFSPAWK